MCLLGFYQCIKSDTCDSLIITPSNIYYDRKKNISVVYLVSEVIIILTNYTIAGDYIYDVIPSVSQNVFYMQSTHNKTNFKLLHECITVTRRVKHMYVERGYTYNV